MLQEGQNPSARGTKRGKGDRSAMWKKRRLAQSSYTGTNPSELIAKTVDDTDQIYSYNITNVKVAVGAKISDFFMSL